MVASFMRNHSAVPFVPLFLLVLAAFVVSAIGFERGRVLEEEERDVHYHVPESERSAYFEELCIDARDPEPDIKTLETLLVGLEPLEFATLIPHVIANLTAKAKALADPLLAAAVKKGGKLPTCLAACATSLDDVSKVISRLPTEISVEGYPEVEKFLLKSFEPDVAPPLCESGCPDKSCSAEKKIIADKFHTIWGLMDCTPTTIWHPSAVRKLINQSVMCPTLITY